MSDQRSIPHCKKKILLESDEKAQTYSAIVNCSTCLFAT